MSSDEQVRNLLRVTADTPLWRVFRGDRLLEACATREIALVAPKKWDDPYENFLSRCSVIVDGQRGTLDGLTRGAFGQCWTSQERETDATWRIYAPREERGIRVKVKAGELMRVIWNREPSFAAHSCFLGAVQYRTAEEIKKYLEGLEVGRDLLDGQGKSIAETLLVKRTEFDHEREVRLLYFDNSGNPPSDGVMRFSCDPCQLIEEVTLDPRLTSQEALLVEKQVRCLGYTGVVNQSPLYRAPEFKPLSL